MTGSPLASLRRIATAKPPPPPGERCEMCAEPVPADHRHVVDLHSRALMCTCRGCHLLFSDPRAEQRYRAIPDRFLSFPGFRLDRTRWDELQIPVGLAFLFTNSTVDRTVAFYPSPAGATESDLPLTAWAAIVAANPELSVLEPDVEALLIRAPGGPLRPGLPDVARREARAGHPARRLMLLVPRRPDGAAHSGAQERGRHAARAIDARRPTARP